MLVEKTLFMLVKAVLYQYSLCPNALFFFLKNKHSPLICEKIFKILELKQRNLNIFKLENELVVYVVHL